MRRSPHCTPPLRRGRCLLAAGRRHRLLRLGRGGNAAMEFALLLPIMVALLLGVVDASDALIAYRRVTVAAEEAALIATELSVQSDGSASLTTTQLYQAATAIFGVMPGLEAGGSSQPFTVTISEIVFIGVAGTGLPAGCSGTACTSYTSYTANVAWSVPLSSFAGSGQYMGTTPAVTRACGVVTQVAPGSTPTLTTLPTLGMTPLTSVLVADVSYLFQPIFLGNVLGVFSIKPTFLHTAMLPPRETPPSTATQYIAYDLANAPDAYTCTGYL
jgi:Flp pilus assembly protein TadG